VAQNQAKIIPAFTHSPALGGIAAIFAGHRALLFLNFEIFRFKFFPDNSDLVNII